MSKKKEIIAAVCKDDADRSVKLSLIDEMLFLEQQLTELKKLPFIKVHPQNPELQKATPAAKQYKELLQQYTNVIKTLEKGTADENANAESPLRKWVKENVK